MNKNILIIRSKLDKLDNIFLNLIKKRTKLVDQVIKNKKFKKDMLGNLGPNYANFGQPSKLNDFNRVYVIIFLSTVGVMLWLKDKSNEIKKGM